MASISLATAALIGGALSGGGAIASSLIGSSAAKSAAGQEVSAEQQGINLQQNEWNQAQANQAPFISAGQISIADLMKDFGNETFGPGSIPQFTAPTLEQAQQTPGYQFTAQQGSKGILEGAGAAGGAISGGTLKSLASFNTNLANSTYSNIYNQALSTYGAQLTGQQQSFNQLLGTAQLGAGAATSTNQTGTASAANLSNLLSSLGQSQAAGTVGSANALTSGLTGGTNNLSQMILLSQLLQGGGAGTNSVNPMQIPQGVTDFGPSGIPPTMPSSTQMPTLYGEVPG